MKILSAHSFPNTIILDFHLTQNQFLRPWSLCSRCLDLMIRDGEMFKSCKRKVILILKSTENANLKWWYLRMMGRVGNNFVDRYMVMYREKNAGDNVCASLLFTEDGEIKKISKMSMLSPVKRALMYGKMKGHFYSPIKGILKAVTKYYKWSLYGIDWGTIFVRSIFASVDIFRVSLVKLILVGRSVPCGSKSSQDSWGNFNTLTRKVRCIFPY